jgi:hypothetical protein
MSNNIEKIKWNTLTHQYQIHLGVKPRRTERERLMGKMTASIPTFGRCGLLVWREMEEELRNICTVEGV